MKLLRLNLRLAATACLLLPLCQSPAGPVPTVSLGQSFTGSAFGTDSSAAPADSNGVIGPGYFVEFNGSFAVYNRTNGQTVKRIADTKFWGNAGRALADTLKPRVDANGSQSPPLAEHAAPIEKAPAK